MNAALVFIKNMNYYNHHILVMYEDIRNAVRYMISNEEKKINMILMIEKKGIIKMRFKKWKSCINNTSYWNKRCQRINILKNPNQELCRPCLALVKWENTPIKKPKKSKLTLLHEWLVDSELDFTSAKTNSIYIDFKNQDDEIVTLKISNHQLVFNKNPFQKPKIMMNSNQDINLSILKNEDFDFADIEKWSFEYNSDKLKMAPDFWIPIFGNWSLEKLKWKILEFKMKIESGN